MNRIFFELKKVTINKFFLVSTVLLFAYFFWFGITGVYYTVENIKPTVSEKVYDALKSGETDTDKLYEYEESIALDVFNIELRPNLPVGIYGETISDDYVAIESATEQVRYARSGYKSDMISMLRSLYTRYTKAQEEENLYLAKYYNKAIEKYNVEYDLRQMDSKSSYEFLALFHFNWESRVFSILFIMWAAFVTVYCLQAEKMNRCHEMVYCTVSGREKTFLRKTVALVILYTVMAVIFALIELIFGITAFRVKDFSAPIQSLQDFEYCTFGLNYLEFFLLINLMRLLAVLFAMGLAMLCTIHAKSLTRPLVVGFGILALLCYMMVVLTGLHGLEVEGYWAYVRTFLPLSLSQPLLYFAKFDYANILGIPFNRLYVCILLFVLLTGVCLLVTCKNYGKAGSDNG